ncbi:MAG TPA: OmpA family protein [Gemmatimonadaceae bacterium]|nr:OmpA family protein [Gemmatimonadaceae bacterium]
MKTHKTIAMVALVVPALAGCATKGYVRDRVAELRTYTDSAISTERSERTAADEALRTDITALRTDLDSLRSEFGARITAMEEGIQFVVPVHFAFDDATVREEDRAVLERFAKVAQKYYGGSVITVEGFADPAGTTRYNLALSRRRAEAVREFLTGAGLSNELRTVGYGENRLITPGAERDDPGAELNRRVVFVIETRGSATSTAASANPD